MYNTLKRMYAKNHGKEMLEKAVSKHWITEEQMNKIILEVDGE